METSTKYGFYLPSSDTDDIADINQISDNFRKIDTDVQEKLESGKNLKTINNQSLLGSGNIEIQGGLGEADQKYSPTSTNAQSGIAVEEAKRQTEAYANKTFASAIRNTVSGDIVKVCDVSPIEHELDVKITSKKEIENVEDLSNVAVTRYGENLVDYTKVENELSTSPLTAVVTTENYIDVQTSGRYVYNYIPLPTLKAGVTYTMRAEVEIYDRKEGTGVTKVQCVMSVNPENPQRSLYNNGDKATWTYTYTPTEDLEDVVLYFRTNYGSDVGAKGKWRITLVTGNQIPEFTPSYQPQKCSANADGTVEGLMSVSPSMMLMTDTADVTIDLVYNADTKMYIDNKFNELATALLNA